MELYRHGSKYSAICVARSALANVVVIQGYRNLSDHPLVSRFVKGILNKHPPLPTYVKTWDINMVLELFDHMGDNSNLSFKDLTRKLVVLLLILGARRRQPIVAIQVNCVLIEHDKCVLLPTIPLKHTRPGKRLDCIEYDAFPENRKLCIVDCTKEYVSQRSARVDETVTSFIITHGKPHRSASDDTISRWTREILTLACVDTNVFTPHSCRSASTSKAKAVGISRSDIMKKAGWSRDSTFKKFYDKGIIDCKTAQFSFGKPLLAAYQTKVNANSSMF